MEDSAIGLEAREDGFGAVASGVDLASLLSDAEAEAIRQAFSRSAPIVFWDPAAVTLADYSPDGASAR